MVARVVSHRSGVHRFYGNGNVPSFQEYVMSGVVVNFMESTMSSLFFFSMKVDQFFLFGMMLEHAAWSRRGAAAYGKLLKRLNVLTSRESWPEAECGIGDDENLCAISSIGCDEVVH